MILVSAADGDWSRKCEYTSSAGEAGVRLLSTVFTEKSTGQGAAASYDCLEDLTAELQRS